MWTGGPVCAGRNDTACRDARPVPDECPVNAPTGSEAAVRASVVRIGAPGDGYDGAIGATGRHGREAALWGSGYFVAPGWVLTCAHVVGPGAAAVWKGERAIGITREDGEVLTGELAFGLPAPQDPRTPPSPWPFPDLALLRVPDAAGDDTDCLWLSDRSALTPADVGLYGWMPGPVPGEPLFYADVCHAAGGSKGPLILSAGRYTEGCSGGPVVDLARGAVVGTIKNRRRSDGSGMAVPGTALRALCDAGPRGARVLHEVLAAHDRHHRTRYLGPGDSWPRRQARAEPAAGGSGYGFTPGRRAELYGLLAGLAPPAAAGQVLRLVNEARDAVMEDPLGVREHDPRSWREGAGLLYEPRDGRVQPGEHVPGRELEAVVVYAALVHTAAAPAADAPAPAAEALRTWVEATEPVLHSGRTRRRIRDILASGGADPAGAPARRADVLVEIDPDLYGTGSHAWRVAVVERPAGPDGEGAPAGAPGGTLVATSEQDAPRACLEEELRGALSRALDQCDVDDHLASVAFVLPHTLFDEPVDRWRARPHDPADPYNPHTLPLGQRRLVVVRSRERRDHGVTPEWRARAKGVAEGPLEAVPLRSEVPREGHTGAGAEGGHAAYGRLRAAPPGAVPVHCSGAGAGAGARALAAALAAGHVVALWRHTEPEGEAGGSGRSAGARGEPPVRHGDCARFLECAGALLAEAHSAEHLPAHIRTLRTANADADDGGPEHPSAAWARHIVLFHHPPDEVPEAALREPPLMPGPRLP